MRSFLVYVELNWVGIVLQDSWVFRCRKGSSVAWEAVLLLYPVGEDDNKGIRSSKPMASSPGSSMSHGKILDPQAVGFALSKFTGSFSQQKG